MKLHAEHTGAGADLVLLHGWGLHSGVWEPCLARLAERYRVHAVDLPGHGLSRDFRAATLDAAADAVLDAMPARAVLCGWSLGGLVAQRAARRAPRRLAALVLVGATPCFVQRADWADGMATPAFEAFDEGLARDVDGTLTRFVQLVALGGDNARQAIRFLSDRLLARGRPHAPALAEALGWLRDNDLRLEAPRIEVPALVVHGLSDALAPVAAGRWLATHVPHARLVELPGAAHIPFFTHPREFTRALESFVG